MNKKYIKNRWIIEKYNQYTNSKKLLAIYDSRLTYSKIIFAMNTITMSESDEYKGILDINSYNSNEVLRPHQYLKYPIIIAESSQYYKAPYRAWVTEFNIKTGEYISIDEMIHRYKQF